MTTELQGTGEPLLIDPQSCTRIIGERINPTGKAKLLQALQEHNWDFVADEALRQVAAGADIIDVNVGGKGIDETAVLPEVIRVVSEKVDVPLSIDTRIPAALEAALAVCPGRPLVNSISGEKKVLAENLPIIAEHGVPVIALCMGQTGIPSTVKERLEIAQQVLEKAVKAGIKEADVIFDPLVMTVGADDQAARLALLTIQRLREIFPNHNITGGASNISFGMPARNVLNSNFLAIAAVMGMNLPITDPTQSELRFSLICADIFLGSDKKTRGYMRYYRQSQLTHLQ